MTWVIMIILLAIIIVSAILIKLLIAEKKLESWAQFTTIVGGIATSISLLWAAYTYYDSAQREKELSASNIYQEHMKISIENPDLANGELAPKPPGNDTSIADKKNYEKYRWYVGHALYSFESILDVSPNDKEWKRTASQFIIDHRGYICSDGFPCNRYSNKIRDLLKEALDKDCP